MQEVILIIVFVAAIGFMARKFYRDYKSESGCASSGCNACSPTEKKDIKLPGHLKS
ncbi:FeoB-associated Cys-rich membrane protein [Roseivirga pacifica]|uniref:FeoB-associated Cys-rich membrane protein n=1 Tax=Roseivirga pacifica TaxID=1267423 RepID=UPI003BAE525B